MTPACHTMHARHILFLLVLAEGRFCGRCQSHREEKFVQNPEFAFQRNSDLKGKIVCVLVFFFFAPCPTSRMCPSCKCQVLLAVFLPANIVIWGIFSLFFCNVWHPFEPEHFRHDRGAACVFVVKHDLCMWPFDQYLSRIMHENSKITSRFVPVIPPQYTRWASWYWTGVTY